MRQDRSQQIPAKENFGVLNTLVVEQWYRSFKRWTCGRKSTTSCKDGMSLRELTEALCLIGDEGWYCTLDFFTWMFIKKGHYFASVLILATIGLLLSWKYILFQKLYIWKPQKIDKALKLRHSQLKIPLAQTPAFY